jgi:hypothetical protein
VSERGRNGGEPVFVPLARTDGQWLHLLIEVLDPEPDHCHEAQPSPLEARGHQLRGSVHERDDGDNCFAYHDHKDVDLPVGARGLEAALQNMVEDALREECQGMHRQLLGGGSDVSVHRQVSQARFEHGNGGESVGITSWGKRRPGRTAARSVGGGRLVAAGR